MNTFTSRVWMGLFSSATYGPLPEQSQNKEQVIHPWMGISGLSAQRLISASGPLKGLPLQIQPWHQPCKAEESMAAQQPAPLTLMLPSPSRPSAGYRGRLPSSLPVWSRSSNIRSCRAASLLPCTSPPVDWHEQRQEMRGREAGSWVLMMELIIEWRG